MRRARITAVALIGLALVLPPVLGSGAGAATEPDILPVNGMFALEGHGYGHGRGMSQWGAQGAATLGIRASEILAFYYPGTTLSTGSDSSTIKVAISDDHDGTLQVRPTSGLRVASGGGAYKVLPLRTAHATVTAWRVTRAASGNLRLQALAGGAWHSVKLSDGQHTVKGPISFRGATSSSRIRDVLSSYEERDYRGQLLAYSSGGTVKVVNRVSMRDYLRSVVPSESLSSWRPAALEAQAVAARTYAMWRARYVPLGVADICDTTSCQVYHGARRTNGKGTVTTVWEAPSTNAAVHATDGKYLSYNGAPALTEFSASNGGFSTDGDEPYLIAKPDPWDGVVANSAHLWTINVKASTINSDYPEIGRIQALRVTKRDGNGAWGGRVLQVKLVGSVTTLTVTGSSFASRVGLRHSWWHSAIVPTPTPKPTVTPTPTVTPPPTVTPTPTPPAPTPTPAPVKTAAHPAATPAPAATPTPTVAPPQATNPPADTSSAYGEQSLSEPTGTPDDPAGSPPQ